MENERCRHTLDLFDALTDNEAGRAPKRRPDLDDVQDWHNRLTAVGGACGWFLGELRALATRNGIVCGRAFDISSPTFTVGEVERVVTSLEQWARGKNCEGSQ